jgi:hypothetical protein
LEKCVDIDYFFPKPVKIKTLIQRLEGRFMTLPQCQGNDHGQQQSESLRERERETEREREKREREREYYQEFSMTAGLGRRTRTDSASPYWGGP